MTADRQNFGQWTHNRMEGIKNADWTVKVGAAIGIATLFGCIIVDKLGFKFTPDPKSGNENNGQVTPSPSRNSTEIAPASGPTTIVEQKYMPQDECLGVVDSQNNSVSRIFTAFKQAQKSIRSLGATYSAWCDKSTDQLGGTYITPFFEVSLEGKVVSENVVMARSDGTMLAVELKPVEIVAPNGKTFLTLSQLVDIETELPLTSPRPFIWVEASIYELTGMTSDQLLNLPVYFNGFGGITGQDAPTYKGSFLRGGKNLYDLLSPKSTVSTPTTKPAEAPTVTKTAPTLKPSETPIPKSEMDLNPAYIKTVKATVGGVTINAQLITDKSLGPDITRVDVSDKAFATYVAETIYKVWLKKGKSNGETFEQFTALWLRAQQTNDPADWDRIAFNIWANDVKDGNGYKQRLFTIWPMYSGPSHDSVRAVNTISIAMVKAGSVKNATIMNDEGGGFGTNMDQDNLIVYDGAVYPGYFDNKSIASGMSGVVWWLSRNTGANMSGYGAEDKSLTDLLVNGGITVAH